MIVSKHLDRNIADNSRMGPPSTKPSEMSMIKQLKRTQTCQRPMNNMLTQDTLIEEGVQPASFQLRSLPELEDSQPHG